MIYQQQVTYKKIDIVLMDFSKILLERYQSYGESERHRGAFPYFATNILPAAAGECNIYQVRQMEAQ